MTLSRGVSGAFSVSRLRLSLLRRRIILRNFSARRFRVCENKSSSLSLSIIRSFCASRSEPRSNLFPFFLFFRRLLFKTLFQTQSIIQTPCSLLMNLGNKKKTLYEACTVAVLRFFFLEEEFSALPALGYKREDVRNILGSSREPCRNLGQFSSGLERRLTRVPRDSREL